jgi:hypothetical protein
VDPWPRSLQSAMLPGPMPIANATMVTSASMTSVPCTSARWTSSERKPPKRALLWPNPGLVGAVRRGRQGTGQTGRAVGFVEPPLAGGETPATTEQNRSRNRKGR